MAQTTTSDDIGVPDGEILSPLTSEPRYIREIPLAECLWMYPCPYESHLYAILDPMAAEGAAFILIEEVSLKDEEGSHWIYQVGFDGDETYQSDDVPEGSEAEGRFASREEALSAAVNYARSGGLTRGLFCPWCAERHYAKFHPNQVGYNGPQDTGMTERFIGGIRFLEWKCPQCRSHALVRQEVINIKLSEKDWESVIEGAESNYRAQLEMVRGWMRDEWDKNDEMRLAWEENETDPFSVVPEEE